MRRKPVREFGWQAAATAALPVLACFLGGATEKWAEGIVVGLLGLLLMLNPPRYSLGRPFNAVLLVLLGWSFVQFLPANWFFLPVWRRALADDFTIHVASTLSPQPWITTGCLLSFFAGLCWLYYASGQEVETRVARRQLRLFALGVSLLAALAVTLHLLHTALPFWHNQRGFGPFPNRNQTANLLALTAIINVACGYDALRRGRKGWLFWSAALVVLVIAIILNFSRAGIGLLLVGSALWLAIVVLRSGSAARIGIGISAVLVLMTAVLVFGGATLERFNLRGHGSGIYTDFRWLIMRDAFTLIRSSSWSGIGLGNFQPIFAIFRDASVGQSQALHPESDWLWLWTELGWPGVALVLGGAAILAKRAFPFDEGTSQSFRLAALVAAGMFAFHGLFDVAGHRVGTAYSGIFLLGLALRRPVGEAATPLFVSLFRAIGLLVFAVGLTWAVASYRSIALPGSLGADTERRLAAAANLDRQNDLTIAHATRGLAWAPLDWQLYFLRALGKVGANRPPAEALEDFRRARFLEPNSMEVPFQEGIAWLTRQPVLTMTAWRDALRRAGPTERPELYARMLRVSRSDPAAERMVQEFGITRPELLLVYLEGAAKQGFAAAIARFLTDDPGLAKLSLEQKTRLFTLWGERGDNAQLIALMDAQPDLLRTGWRAAARAYAKIQDFQRAYSVTQQFGGQPPLPAKISGSTAAQLQKDIYADPNNFAAGYTLYDEQRRSGDVDGALVTVRRFTEQAACPPYFHFLEAEAWAAKQNWERAWTAWQAFDAAAR